MSLGWIVHVTDSGNLPSIQQYGLKTNVKGSGKGGRYAVHFMYHNDNGQGYIRMAEGTTPPRSYKRPVYLVLDPKFIESQQPFLTKNGVVLFHGGISFQYLHVKEQLPTLACNVIHKGRGHALPPSVTGGTWHSDTTWQHAKREKGIVFIPGVPIPDSIRTTAWQFMGQQIPQNYGRLVFGTPLDKEADFDPSLEIIHPSRRPGRSLQREEPESQWEQQRSSSGSSEPPQDDPQQDEPPQDDQQEDTSANVQDDPMGEEVVDLWEAEDPPDDD